MKISMSADGGPAFVDTNVLVYAFDKGEPSRREIARRLLEKLIDEDRIRLSTQVLQEFFVTVTRKVPQRCSTAQALALLEDFTAWPLFVVDYSAIRDAAHLAEDASLSFGDALIVVGASRSGAVRLYCEDLNHGQTILGVEITNPFSP